jgi:xylulokinase
VKAVLVAEDDRVHAQASAPLDVSRPHPLWSEQDPEDWWRATETALAALHASEPAAMAAVRGVGLSGQMHGATLLDAEDRVLRPAILWNDGRSGAACAELARRVPALERITGNRAMPGFTAPKLVWVAEHEPDVFARVAKVLLPKDYVRLRLTGDYASDMSDSAGTLWLDVGARAWSAAMLEATRLNERAMPKLHEGSEATGGVRAEVATRHGMRPGTPVAAGAGDNAAGAAGMGVLNPGQAFVSLGTSGVYFSASERYAPNTAAAVHTFCHCLPDRWHQMSVILSAASCLAWLARVFGTDEATLLAECERESLAPDTAPVFLPYLSGERTPHDDPHAQGVFFGVGHQTSRAAFTWSVLEGVAFAFVDGQNGLLDAGAALDDVAVIGGGARSRLWGRILASALGRPLVYRSGAELGAAFGAARLGRLCATGEAPERVCTPGAREAVVEPEAALTERCARRLPRYRRLYRALRDEFRAER